MMMSEDFRKGFSSGFDLGFEKGIEEGRRRAKIESEVTIDFKSWQKSWDKFEINVCKVCGQHTEGYMCGDRNCPVGMQEYMTAPYKTGKI
jgi:hypothetical protein